MILSRWKNHEVPDYEGIIHSTGNAFTFKSGRLSPSDPPKPSHFLSVSIMASLELFGGRYRVSCGEAAQDGSIGVIVLEGIENGDAVWSFASDQSNPFDQIEVKGGYVLVLSTSGAIFRFREELEDVTISIP